MVVSALLAVIQFPLLNICKSSGVPNIFKQIANSFFSIAAGFGTVYSFRGIWYLLDAYYITGKNLGVEKEEILEQLHASVGLLTLHTSRQLLGQLADRTWVRSSWSVRPRGGVLPPSGGGKRWIGAHPVFVPQLPPLESLYTTQPHTS